jgi:multimeric flavodoxin WrbA
VQHAVGHNGDDAHRKPSLSSPPTGGDRGVKVVPLRILVLYGSYRSDRKGIRLAQHICEELRSRGDVAELIDAKAVGLPIMDRMYKGYPPGEAPTQMEALAARIRQADAFVFVVGEYNWGSSARAQKSHRSLP